MARSSSADAEACRFRRALFNILCRKPENADRVRECSSRLAFAEVSESHRKLVPDLVICGTFEIPHAATAHKTFPEPGRDIDAVAKNIVPVDDDKSPMLIPILKYDLLFRENTGVASRTMLR